MCAANPYRQLDWWLHEKFLLKISKTIPQRSPAPRNIQQISSQQLIQNTTFFFNPQKGTLHLHNLCIKHPTAWNIRKRKVQENQSFSIGNDFRKRKKKKKTPAPIRKIYKFPTIELNIQCKQKNKQITSWTSNDFNNQVTNSEKANRQEKKI